MMDREVSKSDGATWRMMVHQAIHEVQERNRKIVPTITVVIFMAHHEDLAMNHDSHGFHVSMPFLFFMDLMRILTGIMRTLQGMYPH